MTYVINKTVFTLERYLCEQSNQVERMKKELKVKKCSLERGLHNFILLLTEKPTVIKQLMFTLASELSLLPVQRLLSQTEELSMDNCRSFSKGCIYLKVHFLAYLVKIFLSSRGVHLLVTLDSIDTKAIASFAVTRIIITEHKRMVST